MESNISPNEESRPVRKLSALLSSLRQKIEDLFEENYEEEEDVNNAGQYIKKLPAAPVKDQPTKKVNTHLNLISFLNICLGALLSIPVLAWVGRHWIIPHFFLGRELWPVLVCSGAVIFTAIFIVLECFWKFLYGLLAGIIIFLGINQQRQESYDFSALHKDYISWLEFRPQHVDLPDAGNIRYSHNISHKLKGKVRRNYKHFRIKKLVKQHSYSLKESPGASAEILKWESCIHLFVEIRKDWQYAYDPPNRDVFNNPQRSARIMQGDCDDWATFIAALYLQMDCEVRLIITRSHVYPELAIPSEEEFHQTVAPMIRSLDSYIFGPQEPLCYHLDPEGRVWLNMDFTAPYPGAPFLHEEVYEIIRF